MAAISQIQMAVTTEGLETLAAMVANGTVFTLIKFRISDAGNETEYEAKKSFRALDPNAFYMDFTAAEFESGHGASVIDLSAQGISDTDGFITINSVSLADHVTVEMDCYIPPTAGLSFTCNEIMIYTELASAPGIYKSFIWGIMPEITKNETYGINFKTYLQF
jgi:hypothetical protein